MNRWICVSTDDVQSGTWVPLHCRYTWHLTYQSLCWSDKKKLAMKGVPVRWPPTSDTKHEHFSFRPQPIQRVGCPSLLLGMKVGYIASHLKEKAYRAFKSPYSSFSEHGQGHHFSEDGRGGFIWQARKQIPRVNEFSWNLAWCQASSLTPSRLSSKLFSQPSYWLRAREVHVVYSDRKITVHGYHAR